MKTIYYRRRQLRRRRAYTTDTRSIYWKMVIIDKKFVDQQQNRESLKSQ